MKPHAGGQPLYYPQLLRNATETPSRRRPTGQEIKKNKKIGWIGTGTMGNSMAGHMIKNGYNLMINNRTKSKADNLVQQGAKWESIENIAKESDYLFLMLGMPDEVEKLVLGDP